MIPCHDTESAMTLTHLFIVIMIQNDFINYYLPTSSAKSPLIVPGAESDGLVAPSI